MSRIAARANDDVVFYHVHWYEVGIDADSVNFWLDDSIVDKFKAVSWGIAFIAENSAFAGANNYIIVHHIVAQSQYDDAISVSVFYQVIIARAAGAGANLNAVALAGNVGQAKVFHGVAKNKSRFRHTADLNPIPTCVYYD